MIQCAIIIILGLLLICLGVDRAINIHRSQILSAALNTITLKESGPEGSRILPSPVERLIFKDDANDGTAGHLLSYSSGTSATAGQCLRATPDGTLEFGGCAPQATSKK